MTVIHGSLFILFHLLLNSLSPSALDNENERKVQEALDQMQKVKRRTTLVIAHR